ncbi:MAG: beta-galactosidase [bacterium]
MYVGVDYYPEHWPLDRWETDARLMREAGFNVVRLAEFAWAKMEPKEGQYDFDWLDRALAILHKNGISAILGTPTGSMPAWLMHRYPKAMVMNPDGSRVVWGMRKDNCFSNRDFRRLSRNITTAMAQHFRRTPNVIGWQTDNELGGQDLVCHCPACRTAFQQWLRKRYQSLGELNRAWGTHFWAHQVGAWEEIVIPSRQHEHNPSACLDWKRFYSWQNVDFQHEQVQILRQHCVHQFVTHNLMGLFKELDYYELARDLDFVSWDNYPVRETPMVRYRAALGADLMRGVKGKNFWIMEQSAGASGWGSFGRNPRPGEIRNIAYQQLARGCDGQVWFRWRTCTAGREQYWHGLLGHDGRPLRRYQEAAQTAREYHRLAPLLKDTTVKAEAAILYDYQSLWALDIQPGYASQKYHMPHKPNLGQQAVSRYHEALFRAGVNADVVSPDADFSRYRMVVAPHLYILPDALADRLNAYVRQGGVLVTDCRTGVKDESGLCHPRTLPGRLSDLLGIEIQEYESVAGDGAYAVTGRNKFAGSFTAGGYADWIQLRGATAFAGYTAPHMRTYAALTRNRFGKGTGWYCGTVVKEPAFYDRLVAGALRDAGIKPVLTPPAGVEVSVRENKTHRLLFLVNHTETKKRVKVPAGKKELITGKLTAASLALEPFGVAVIHLQGKGS